MQPSRSFPDANRLSIVAATILLAYALASFVDLPIRPVELQLPGFLLAFDINAHTAVAVLVAGLTASGADWLFRDHPALKGRSTLQHWLLPALTALVIGIPLARLPFDLRWFAGFVIGGVLLMLVLVAEYIVVDPVDSRHALATAGLTAVSFALFLILAIVLRSAEVRLFLILPSLTIASALVSLRTLHLRLQGKWAFLQTLGLALIVAQFTAALHYWPVSPISYGLLLLGPAYALTSLVGNLSEGETLRQAVGEPVMVILIVWGTALWTG